MSGIFQGSGLLKAQEVADVLKIRKATLMKWVYEKKSPSSGLQPKLVHQLLPQRRAHKRSSFTKKKRRTKGFGAEIDRDSRGKASGTA